MIPAMVLVVETTQEFRSSTSREVFCGEVCQSARESFWRKEPWRSGTWLDNVQVVRPAAVQNDVGDGNDDRLTVGLPLLVRWLHESTTDVSSNWSP